MHVTFLMWASSREHIGIPWRWNGVHATPRPHWDLGSYPTLNSVSKSVEGCGLDASRNTSSVHITRIFFYDVQTPKNGQQLHQSVSLKTKCYDNFFRCNGCPRNCRCSSMFLVLHRRKLKLCKLLLDETGDLVECEAPAMLTLHNTCTWYNIPCTGLGWRLRTQANDSWFHLWAA